MQWAGLKTDRPIVNAPRCLSLPAPSAGHIIRPVHLWWGSCDAETERKEGAVTKGRA